MLKRFWWVPVALLGREYVGITSITGRSMSPTLNPNTDTEKDVCLIWKTNFVNVGDIVSFMHPFMNIAVVKRVTAIAGERLLMKNRYGKNDL